MKQRLIRFRTCVLITLALTLLLVSAALAADFGVVYRTDTLNLRSQGSSQSQWLGAYSRGTWMEITGSQNNFYRVITPDGRVGYMSKNYIDLGCDATDYVWTATVSNHNGGAYLNFRAQPGYNTQVLDLLYDGVPLRVQSGVNGWYCVKLNGQTGYVLGDFVIDHGRSRAGSDVVATIKTPNNTAMNLRSGPGKKYGVLAQFPGDTYVSVLAKGNGWWCVSVNGLVGYMSSDFLKEGLCAARDLYTPNNSSQPDTGRPYAVVSNPRSTQALNFREYPSTGAVVLDSLYNGDRLWVNQQGLTWCAVTDPTTGISGYVMTDYITLHYLPTTPTLRVYHPSGSYVNLRSSADMGLNNVLARVPSGQTVTVLAPGQEWYKVRYGNYTGYMLGYFLK